MNPHSGGEWVEWSRYVLKELERLNEVAQQIQHELQEARVEIAMLKVKASLWGGLTGLLVTLGAILLQLLRR